MLPIPKINNVVSVIDCDVKLDLPKLFYRFPMSKSKFHIGKMKTLSLKINDPKTTLLFFASGKIVCTGATSEEQSYKAATFIIDKLRDYGYGAWIKEFRVQNIVANVDVQFHIQLGPLFNDHNTICSYEPELFPGLVYRMKEPKVSIIVFTTGKVNIIGSKNKEELDEAFNKIYSILSKYKVDIVN